MPIRVMTSMYKCTHSNCNNLSQIRFQCMHAAGSALIFLSARYCCFLYVLKIKETTQVVLKSYLCMDTTRGHPITWPYHHNRSEWKRKSNIFPFFQFELGLNKQNTLECKGGISSYLEKAKEEATIKIFSVLSPSCLPPNEHSLQICKHSQVLYLTHCPTAAYLYHKISWSL